MEIETIVTIAVSKRVFITLPDSIFDDLEWWAVSEGRPTANLAAFLIEVAIRGAKEQGKIPPKTPNRSETLQAGSDRP